MAKLILLALTLFFTSGVAVLGLENQDIPVSPKLYISEINYAGSTSASNCKTTSTGASQCSNDKWLEIYNPGSEAVNLQGFKVQRFDELGKLFSLGSISQSTVINPNGYGLITSKNSNLNSLLNEIKGEVTKVSPGLLNGISGNTAGKKYIRVALTTNDNSIISKVSLNNTEIESLESSIAKKDSEKFSISFEADPTKAKIAKRESQYFQNNFATPGLPYAFKVSPEIEKPKPEIALSPVIVPVESPKIAESTLPAISTIETKPVESTIKNELTETVKATQSKPEINKAPEISTAKVEKPKITETVTNRATALTLNTTQTITLSPIQRDLASIQEVSGLNSPQNMAVLNVLTVLAMLCSRISRIYKNFKLSNLSTLEA